VWLGRTAHTIRLALHVRLSSNQVVHLEVESTLLIMAKIEAKKGNDEAAARLFLEAITLLKQSGARNETVKYYESIQEKHQTQIKRSSP